MILEQKKAYKMKLFPIVSVLSSILFLFFSWLNTAFAATVAQTEAASFVATFNSVILYPTIALLAAVALLVFIWGGFEYFMNAANDQARQKGVKHITYGIIGLVVMLSAYAILSIAAATFGLDDEIDCATDPSGPGCATVFTL